MKQSRSARVKIPVAVVLGWLSCCAAWVDVTAHAAGTNTAEIRILELQGSAELSPSGAATWVSTQTNQVLRPLDRLRTGPNSRVTLRWSDQSVVPFGALTEIEILPPHQPDAQGGLHLINGILSFFHRDKPGQIRIITRGAVAGVKGTEFVVAVDTVNDTERTTLSVVDGEVQFGNEHDTLFLTNRQQAVAEVGKAPVRTAGFIANNVLQWCFYYPAVLDLRELPLTPEEQVALVDSLAAYREGDLLTALARYPEGRQRGSDAERVYYAALLLSVGQVEKTQAAFADLPAGDPSDRLQRLATALRQLIAAVKREPSPSTLAPQLSTELLAASYYEQSLAVRETSLRGALALARRAATNSPEFGFAWARVAELEFSFGQTSRALETLDKALTLTPRNAQALALKGFLFAAQNKTREAIDSFNQSLAVDSALGNAWLGRGLARIRRGDVNGGREDLLVAVALEPQRAQLRAYLGKAYGYAGETERALHELDLAKQLDPNDPSAWLYSALVKADHNRINEAIRDVQKSQELNDNPRVYRSSVLLDQDRAVRSVNLAHLYQDADLSDWSVHEANLAVVADYSSYAAHLFLANSYEVARRESLSSLRYEAASLNEYLLANLLGPASGRLLAQPITRLGYSELFERDGFGSIANTEYLSYGAWRNSSAQYGTFKGTGYSLEAEYLWDPGERKNQELQILQLEAKIKQDITPDDSVLLHVIGYDSSGGDISQHYDAGEVSSGYQFEEEQVPTVLAGYHHRWSPQNHTLFLAGYFGDSLNVENTTSAVLGADRTTGEVIGFAPVNVEDTYSSDIEVFMGEAQQIALLGRHSLVAGVRGQWSKQNVKDRVENPYGEYFFLLGQQNPVSVQDEDVTSATVAVYGYDTIRLSDTLELVGGLNFTYQSIPVNTTTSPLSSQQEEQTHFGPKAGVIWTPSRTSTIRASYTSSLTGYGLGQSVRLEPAQVAGLLQSFRSPVPPALVGALDGAELQTAELVWQGRFRDTYLALGGQWLAAERDRQVGLFLMDDPNYVLPPTSGSTEEEIQFTEYALYASAHQLVGDEWSFGVQYRLAYAQLNRRYPEYPGLGLGGVEDDWQGWLQTLNLTGLYRHPCGVFARAEGIFFAQQREREEDSQPGDNFWQVNLSAGYRFPKQKAEISVGVLNLLDTDYRLDPINQQADSARSRTFFARLLINF